MNIQSAAVAVFGIRGGMETELAVWLWQLGHVLQGEQSLISGGGGEEGRVRGGGGALQQHRGWDQRGPPGGNQRGPAPREGGHCGRPSKGSSFFSVSVYKNNCWLLKDSIQSVLNLQPAWRWHLFVFEDWLFPTKSCDLTSPISNFLYLEGLESMTIFSMPGGTWGPVNLAEPVAESQDMEEGEGAISELMVSLRRLGVGE